MGGLRQDDGVRNNVVDLDWHCRTSEVDEASLALCLVVVGKTGHARRVPAVGWIDVGPTNGIPPMRGAGKGDRGRHVGGSPTSNLASFQLRVISCALFQSTIKSTINPILRLPAVVFKGH